MTVQTVEDMETSTVPPAVGPLEEDSLTESDKRSLSIYDKTPVSPADDLEAASPSRHLWVGNLSTSLTEAALSEHFARFGEVENVAFDPPGNYAFVVFKNAEDAAYAKKGLQKTSIDGSAIRIEFAKMDGRFEDNPNVDEVIAWRDQQGSAEPHGTFAEGGKSNAEKLKRDNKDGDPSEVLWVGFPKYMKVDERKLRRAFAPFGAIERITTFPGRTYAFVQFQSLEGASRAKDALQGNLFNDPRVSISFAKSEVGPTDQSRGISNFVPPLVLKAELPPLILLPKVGNSVNPRNDRFLGLHGSRAVGLSFSNRSADDFLQNPLYERELHLNMRNGLEQAVKRGHEHGIEHELGFWVSPPPMPSGVFPYHSHVQYFEDTWNAPEQSLGKGHLKRQRIGADHHPGTRGLVGLSSFEAGNDQVVKGPNSLSRGTLPDAPKVAPLGSWENYEGPVEGPVRFPQGRPPIPTSKMDPLSVQAQNDWAHPWASVDPPKEAVQWRGLIAKSGTSVFYARSYAVSHIMDISFPEIVNCTARTSLDMLANYINQVGDFAVYSFIPEGELDVAPYQEFITYLSEKKRAAVCKLSLESTLFLVPPSEFVERFLKVPLVSVVFGVVLRLPLQHPLSDAMPSLLPYNALLSADALSTSNTQSQQAGLQSNVSNPLTTPIPAQTNGPGHRPIVANNGLGRLPQSSASMQHDEHLLQRSLPTIGDLRSHQEQALQLHFNSVTPPTPIPERLSVTQGPSFVNNSHTTISGSVPFSVQHAMPPYPPPNMQPSQYPMAPAHQPLPSHSVEQPSIQSQLSASGPMHVQQQALTPNFGPTQGTWPKAGVQRPSFPDAKVDSEVKERLSEAQQHESLQVSQQMVSTGTNMRGEGDDNKRFQATLQLAAALLQQLQQKTDT